MKEIVVLLIFISKISFGQDFTCGNEIPSELVSTNVLFKPSLSINVPVFFHIIVSTNGDGDVQNNQLNNQISVLNSFYDDANISFYLAGISRTIEDDWRDLDYGSSQYGGPKSEEIDMKNTLAIDTEHVLNVYITSINGGILGWGLYPFDYYANQNKNLHGVVIEPIVLPSGLI